MHGSLFDLRDQVIKPRSISIMLCLQSGKGRAVRRIFTRGAVRRKYRFILGEGSCPLLCTALGRGTRQAVVTGIYPPPRYSPPLKRGSLVPLHAVQHALKTNTYNMPLVVMTKFKIFIFRYLSQSANRFKKYV